MTVTPTPPNIVLRFTWDDAFEDLYSSRRHDVVVAERGHRRRADRFNRRHAVIAILDVALMLAVAIAAIAYVRLDPSLLARIGIGREEITYGIAAMSVLAALLTLVQAFARYAGRAERERIAAMRYGALQGEMAAILATPRSARPEPDLALNGVRERIDRYAEECPAVPRRIRRRVAAEVDREASVPEARQPSLAAAGATAPVAEP